MALMIIDKCRVEIMVLFKLIHFRWASVEGRGHFNMMNGAFWMWRADFFQFIERLLCHNSAGEIVAFQLSVFIVHIGRRNGCSHALLT